MTYGCFARWARCRGTSLFARRMNLAAFDGGKRGLAASPMLKAACAETFPALSFAEQRIAGSTDCLGEFATADSSVDGAIMEQLVEQLTGPGAVLVNELFS